MSTDGASGQNDEERVQINVTLKRSTLNEMRRAIPNALDDSERIRRAVSESIERNGASEYTIRR